MKKTMYIIFSVFFSLSIFGQDTISISTIEINQNKLIIDKNLLVADSDSILQKEELKKHAEVTLIDSLWLQEMYSSPLYDSIRYVMNDSELEDVENVILSTELLKERLVVLNNETPFNIEYNQGLERVIRLSLIHI